MFRPVGIVVAFFSREAYFLALAFGDFVGLAAFLAVFLAGAAFFVAISLAPLGKDIGYQC